VSSELHLSEGKPIDIFDVYGQTKEHIYKVGGSAPTLIEKKLAIPKCLQKSKISTDFSNWVS
jgi:hypothetical protein